MIELHSETVNLLLHEQHELADVHQSHLVVQSFLNSLPQTRVLHLQLKVSLSAITEQRLPLLQPDLLGSFLVNLLHSDLIHLVL